MKQTATQRTAALPATATRNHARAQADQRPAAVAQRQALAAIENSSRQVAQRRQLPAVLPSRNAAGLPAQLKAGVENLSGQSLDDVRVHYNSAQPAALQAHAYAQGADIHLAPGQEQYLPHEAWHVAQQKQGRVKPTTQLKGTGVNNQQNLEHEASEMGERAAQFSGSTAPRNLAQGTARGNVAQLVERRIPKGTTPPDLTWKFLRDEGPYAVYDDNQTEKTSLDSLKSTRDVTAMMLEDDKMSDVEYSDTEIDTSGEKKPITGRVMRVHNMRQALKVQRIYQKDKSNYSKNRAVRIGKEGKGGVFRLVGKDSQVHVKAVAKNKLKRKGAPTEGYMPEPIAKKDTAATGSIGSYEHLVSPFASKGEELGKALHGKFLESPAQDYPGSLTDYEKYKMDETLAVTTLAETLRTPYAFPLAVASIQALKNGVSTRDVFYKGPGKGAVEALHPGTSSQKHDNVSGQLMEQNLGLGQNNPHPTQKNMSLSDADFVGGADRTKRLFDKATAPGETHFQMLTKHMGSLLPSAPVVASPAPSIATSDVTTERASSFPGASVSLKVKSATAYKAGQKVNYKGTEYTIKNITPTGWVNLV